MELNHQNIRKHKELLQVFLDNQDLFKIGLCSWTANLLVKSKINRKEYLYLSAIIEENEIESIYGSYYWEPKKIKPRIKFLKKHLK